ncbi:hypothetical protein KC319_g7724 [Hortaea werneckii]|nr:hypothetical protein KC319_g7724 [Hortaea werneckii]
MKEIDITGLEGEKLNDKWKSGTFTYLGMSVANFPNMLYTYGPQSPTAYANGPSIVEPQDEWIVDVMRKMREQGKTRLNPEVKAEREWKGMVNTIHAMTLRDKVDGWYMGTNIPGKPREALNYAGGIPLYLKTIREAIQPEWKGFTVT